MGTTKIHFPRGITEEEDYEPLFEDGDEILGYCNSCTKKPDCNMNKELRSAMGDNYPYWNDSFVFVLAQRPYRADDEPIEKTFCNEYENNQLELPNIKREFSDGVERLLRVLEEEKLDYIEARGDFTKDKI
jgi:hypothetical protein